MESLSNPLKEIIIELMQEPILESFNLGGGTNLALKYNHRVSKDIDLFSNKVVGIEKIKQINNFLMLRYKDNDLVCQIRNNNIENLAFIKAVIIKNSVPINIDIIQNVPLSHPIQTIENIRLIHDLDIGALKLLSAADRGTRKDFYDLYLLSKKYGLPKIYNELIQRHKKFTPTQKQFENIFNIDTDKPKETLEKSITALGNFNNSSDLKKENNRVLLTTSSPIKISWPELKRNWIEDLKSLSKQKNLTFKETPFKRKNKHSFF